MATRTLHLEPLDAAFGAVVRGVAVRDIEPDEFEMIREAWLTHGLLIFSDQHLTPEDQDVFARRFGQLEFTATPLTNIRSDGSLRDPSHELSKSLRANEGWHHDSTYMPVQAAGVVFTAEIVTTSGGATGFADMRAAYDDLDEAARSDLAGRTARHSRRFSMERAGLHISESAASASQLYGFGDVDPPIRPLVKVHPETGRPNLLAGQHAYDVSGLSPHESEAMLHDLTERSTAEPFTYHHTWRVGDAVLWDNRRLMHRATPHDPAEPRRMWHTRIAGDPATESALNHQPLEHGPATGTAQETT